MVYTLILPYRLCGSDKNSPHSRQDPFLTSAKKGKKGEKRHVFTSDFFNFASNSLKFWYITDLVGPFDKIHLLKRFEYILHDFTWTFGRLGESPQKETNTVEAPPRRTPIDLKPSQKARASREHEGRWSRSSSQTREHLHMRWFHPPKRTFIQVPSQLDLGTRLLPFETAFPMFSMPTDARAQHMWRFESWFEWSSDPRWYKLTRKFVSRDTPFRSRDCYNHALLPTQSSLSYQI